MTLADIQNEIKSMRKEVKKDTESMEDTAKICYERSLNFSAMAVAVAITLLGCSVLITQSWQAIFLIAFGFGCFIYFRRRFSRVGKGNR